LAFRLTTEELEVDRNVIFPSAITIFIPH